MTAAVRRSNNLTETATADMAAFCASESACYRWPLDTVEHRALREAYCAGAAWAAPDVEQMRNALAEMTVEFVAAHKAGNISTMPQTAQRIVRNAENCFKSNKADHG